MSKSLASLAAVAVAALSMGLSASAAVTTVENQAAFNAAGTITQNTNWDSYPGSEFFFPGSPFVVGDLTFVESDLSIIGEAAGVYNTGRNLLFDNSTQGTTIQIAGLHDLFAFNLGNFFDNGAANIIIVTTNLETYKFFPDVTLAVDSGGVFTFAGFQASAGEYFTSVKYSGGNATGATDIQLGSTGVVPEPSTWAMMIGGFGMAGAMLRRRKAVAA